MVTILQNSHTANVLLSGYYILGILLAPGDTSTDRMDTSLSTLLDICIHIMNTIQCVRVYW